MEKLTTEMKAKLFPDNLILMGYRGSVAHNMYVPNTEPNSTDDIDLMGVFMAPLEHYVGLKQCKQTVERFVGVWDTVSYEFIHFVRLLLKSNPNVLSMLWLKPEFYFDLNDYGKLLVDNKDIFVTKNAYFPFKGYAKNQIDKMTAFNKEGYMGQKRKALVNKFGYDTKNAAHCIRLMKMCIEFLETGALNVYRTDDVDWLLNIKNGGWTLDEVKEAAAELAAKAEAAYEKSNLPRNPDYDRANKLVQGVVLDYTDKMRTK